MIALRLRRLARVSLAAALVAGTLGYVTADAATLTVNVSARGNQRSTWQDAFDKFKKANPDVDLKVTYITEEAYKVQMGGWLATDPPDVVSWHDGERMAYYAQRGLLEDLTPDWNKNGWSQQYASVKEASTYKGKQYAAPLGYDAYGFFYRKDLFEKAGVKSEPKTWDEFLDACKKLKASGVAPIAVAARDSWTLAAWFDYLDLRINGNEFHQKLMAGEIPYTDARVKKVYTAWKTLIDDHYYIDNALSYDLDSIAPFLVSGKASMMLMGTFFSARKSAVEPGAFCATEKIEALRIASSVKHLSGPMCARLASGRCWPPRKSRGYSSSLLPLSHDQPIEHGHQHGCGHDKHAA